MTELEKMKAGMWYDANNNPEVLKERYGCFDKCFTFNQLKPSDPQRYQIMKDILGYLPDNLEVVTPFQCDYGKNIHLGKNVFINAYCYFMDGIDITIGDYVFIGPYCGFYTATHPIDYQKRNQGLEKALPIKVGNNCWFGANVSVMPGVMIGEDCVIGAGAVVTKDIPAHSVVAGIPAKVIKKTNERGVF